MAKHYGTHNLSVNPSPEMFARALIDTSDRYTRGMMSRATFKSHMASLWGRIEHGGLKERVIALVDPLSSTRIR